MSGRRAEGEGAHDKTRKAWGSGRTAWPVWDRQLALADSVLFLRSSSCSHVWRHRAASLYLSTSIRTALVICTRPRTNLLAAVAQVAASERYVAFAVR